MPTYRIVCLSTTGKFEQEDFTTCQPLADRFEQIGVEEDSYTLRLHGQPVYKGLIGPISDGPAVVRYETPDAYAAMTEIWAKTRRPRRRRPTDTNPQSVSE
jgi:hypothetical protein